MAKISDNLLRIGLHFDDENKIRVLDQESYKQTTELKDQCSEFIKNTSDFKSMVDNFIGIVEKLSTCVERAKTRALGSRNALKSINKQQELEKQRLQALITEKMQKLERLNVQEVSLAREESEQFELIQQLTNNH